MDEQRPTNIPSNLDNASLVRYDNEGIELIIDTQTGESFATKRGYSRMSGKDESTIRKRVKGGDFGLIKDVQIQTPGGLQGADLIPGKIATRWLAKDNPELLAAMSEVGWNIYCHKLAGYNVTSTAIEQAPQFDLPKDYLSALKALVSSEEEKLQLTAQNELYAGKLDEAEDVIQAYRAITNDEVCLSVKQVADALNIPRLGRNNLIKYLREKQVILPESTGPYRRALEASWVIAETTTYLDGQGIARPIVTTRLTFKGLSWLVKSLIKDNYQVSLTAAQIWDTYNPPPSGEPVFIAG